MNPVQLSKFMSLVLRHRAHAFGLSPDPEGFVPLEALVALVQAKFSLPDAQGEILAVVEQGRPQRFELRGDLIRATYGHSTKNAPVTYPPADPPPILFHGTHSGAVVNIRKNGLRAMKRQYVHLSTTQERATEVARRRTEQPVILAILAQQAQAAGVVFHSPEAHHFLAKSIPAEFIVFPLCAPLANV